MVVDAARLQMEDTLAFAHPATRDHVANTVTVARQTRAKTVANARHPV
jgi:hypothetical protein